MTIGFNMCSLGTMDTVNSNVLTVTVGTPIVAVVLTDIIRVVTSSICTQCVM